MKKQFPLFLFAVAVLSMLSCNGQQNKNDELDSFINRMADSLYKNQKVPGIFIGVLNNGIRKYYNFGYAAPAKKLPFDSTSVFEIGSITKTFTAYVLENVLKEKSINDSSSIITFLPDSVQQNSSLRNIHFINLLNHTSGLPRMPDNIDLASRQPYENYGKDKLFSFLKRCSPKPTGHYVYSNLGFGLLAVLASSISKKSYRELIDRYIFHGWGINRLRSLPVDSSHGFLENDPVEYWKFDALAGAGAIVCSANEMLSYFQHMAHPASRNEKIIIDSLLTPTYNLAPTMNVCRAWHTIEEKNKPVIYWHNGGTYGFSTFGAFIKGENKAVIVVVNQFNKNIISDGLGRAIMNKLLSQ
jgi:CubicO group peptidase (beta-lactamase class C family)